MEDINTAQAPPEVVKTNKLAVIGFLLMVAGPLLLTLARLFVNLFGNIHEIAAGIIAWTASSLPGIGAVIGIVALFRWKRTKKLGRALAIVTVVMCNPFFYILYFVACSIFSRSLAGLSLM